VVGLGARAKVNHPLALYRPGAGLALSRRGGDRGCAFAALVAQGLRSDLPILMAGAFSSGAGFCRAANKVI
jgi:hypothetical protein